MSDRFAIESKDGVVEVRASNGGLAVMAIADYGGGMRVQISSSFPGDLIESLALAKVYVQAIELAIRNLQTTSTSSGEPGDGCGQAGCDGDVP
jgi:hypothetical protein